ncbi:DUF5615 family PIN-like protein [Halococcus salsus]|uniref:DUF5615 family PIN-like protein n=1 Tax=Halococcus salsus TaxID=2162894 RepID=UPI00135A30C1|nr:DUF5615 family PIN-like protein [Halococcus salsus]
MTLRLLCDENIERELFDALTPEFETIWVVTKDDLERGTDDPVLWTYAAQRGYTILTNDDDFVTGAAEVGSAHPDVIHLTEIMPTGDVVRTLRRISQFTSTDELVGQTVYVPGDWL